MDKYRITSLDEDGMVVDDHETVESWCISELKLYFDEMAMDLYHGKVANIAVSKIED